MSERRRQPRIRTTGLSARVRPGHRAEVIDLSPAGVLLEAKQPFRPGASVQVQFEGPARHARLSARVVRCSVCAVHPDRGLTYRAGLSFDEACEWDRERSTHAEYAVPIPGHSASNACSKDAK